jgi:predicted DNA-binding transcriptional regulator YafY
MRADRLISLMLLLQNRGRMTCAELARVLEVSRRTVLRDIDALSYAGIPLITEGGPGGGVRLRDEYRTSLTGLTDDEVRSLFFSRDGALFGDLGWGNAYRMSQLKLDAALPAAARSAAEAAQRRILIDSRWWWHQEQPEEALGLLQEAVFGDRSVRFGYERYNGSASRVNAEAYALVAKSGLWYLVGKRRGEMRSYRVSRIQNAALSRGAFTRDRDFDVRQWWPAHSKSFADEFSSYKCTLSVPQHSLRLVQRMAPGRVKLADKGGGKAPVRGRWATVEIGVESEWYAQLIVVGLGKSCRIVSPRELSVSVAARVKEVQAALGVR